jgi:cytoplasmic iron level regulating protein YaaA (DUF328/UPF0246 family)
MIFLLPPSESKQTGGTRSSLSLSFPSLDPTRTLVLKALVELLKNPQSAASALKLGPKQLGELQVNLELSTPKTMPALDRYTGVLYDALKLGGLYSEQLKMAKQSLFIQSSLFGLISALDHIPNYRLSAGARLTGINLKHTWSAAHEGIWDTFRSELVVDLRSKAYAMLAPIPPGLDCYQVEVVAENALGQTRALNHFNKAAKGHFLRSAISLQHKPTKLGDLEKIAKLAGMKLEFQGRTLLLVTNL